MSRLLLVHCPINPRTLNPSGVGDIDFAAPSEGFRWCLLARDKKSGVEENLETGQGPVSSIPVADEALILIPTVDVRLIHTRLPLIAGKKLDALLPTLAEPFLIEQRTPMRYQAFPPIPGMPAGERTIAIISASWMSWLESQLAALAVRQVSMIPDCLLLDQIDHQDNAPMFLQDFVGNYAVLSIREGHDWGAGWIEPAARQSDDAHNLINSANHYPFDWSWIAPRAFAWLSQKTSVNLILQAPEKPKKQLSLSTVRWQPKVEWVFWRQPLKLAAISATVYLTGSLLYLATLAISNWRWDKVTEGAARQNLNTTIVSSHAVLPNFIEQATSKIHASGGQTAGDFIPMASKLQSLLTAYPTGLLESVTYQPGGLEFRLKNTQGTPEAVKLEQRAQSLDLAIVTLGRNEYKLLPYAGLLGSTAQKTRP